MEQTVSNDFQALLMPFLGKFNTSETVGSLIEGWDRVFRISITDAEMNIDLLIEGGKIGMSTGTETYDRIGFAAEAQVLQAVFSGEENPAIALAMGQLAIEGNEEDIMKLQIIANELWN
jgi:putative sterol carrier protein